MSQSAPLAERLREVDGRITDAARAAGRDPAGITRIVVTKFHPASIVRELAELGVQDVGENRQQELSAKRAELADLDVRWHFVGQAQTKKARAIRDAASVVHSVDRSRLADALDAAAGGGGEDGDDDRDDAPLDVLMQINLTDDPARGGVVPVRIPALAEHIVGCRTLRLRGVMAVAPLDEPPASAFERLAGYAGDVRRVVPDARWISAGMTGDFVEALAAGATHLRIGTAITGNRPARA